MSKLRVKKTGAAKAEKENSTATRTNVGGTTSKKKREMLRGKQDGGREKKGGEARWAGRQIVHEKKGKK